MKITYSQDELYDLCIRDAIGRGLLKEGDPVTCNSVFDMQTESLTGEVEVTFGGSLEKK